MLITGQSCRLAATLLFEGTKSEIDAQEKNVYRIAAKYGGMKAGVVSQD